MRPAVILQNALLASSALLIAGAHFAPDRDHNGPVLTVAVSFVGGDIDLSSTIVADSTERATSLASLTRSALAAFTGVVKPLSRPEALETAFRSYFAFKAAH